MRARAGGQRDLERAAVGDHRGHVAPPGLQLLARLVQRGELGLGAPPARTRPLLPAGGLGRGAWRRRPRPRLVLPAPGGEGEESTQASRTASVLGGVRMGRDDNPRAAHPRPCALRPHLHRPGRLSVGGRPRRPARAGGRRRAADGGQAPRLPDQRRPPRPGGPGAQALAARLPGERAGGRDVRRGPAVRARHPARQGRRVRGGLPVAGRARGRRGHARREQHPVRQPRRRRGRRRPRRPPLPRAQGRRPGRAARRRADRPQPRPDVPRARRGVARLRRHPRRGRGGDRAPRGPHRGQARARHVRGGTRPPRAGPDARGGRPARHRRRGRAGGRARPGAGPHRRDPRVEPRPPIRGRRSWPNR